jgi:hypothetical protein
MEIVGIVLSERFQLGASEIQTWTAERRQCWGEEEEQKEDKYLQRGWLNGSERKTQ